MCSAGKYYPVMATLREVQFLSRWSERIQSLKPHTGNK
jgi:hypothetical protein